MLRDQADNNDTINNNEASNDEEQYQRLFKKIARDFVCKADLEIMLTEVVKKLKEEEKEEEREIEKEERNTTSTIGAIMKAIEYKANLSLPKHKRIKYRDIIDDE